MKPLYYLASIILHELYKVGQPEPEDNTKNVRVVDPTSLVMIMYTKF